jgi:DNA-binding protein
MTQNAHVALFIYFNKANDVKAKARGGKAIAKARDLTLKANAKAKKIWS